MQLNFIHKIFILSITLLYIYADENIKTKSTSLDTLIKQNILIRLSNKKHNENVDIFSKKEIKNVSLRGVAYKNTVLQSLSFSDKNKTTPDIAILPITLNIKNDKFVKNNINLSSLSDGAIEVKAVFESENGTLYTVTDTIYKDTIPPPKPEIDKNVLRDNLINGRGKEALVLSGYTEKNSNIIITMRNKLKEPSRKLRANVKSDENGYWILKGKDVDVRSLKNGSIEIKVYVIDTAGNEGKPYLFRLKNKRNFIFPQKPTLIKIEDYVPIFTINEVNDATKSITTNKSMLFTGTYGYIHIWDKKYCVLRGRINTRSKWVNSLVVYKNTIIGGLDDNTIRIWDIKTKKLLKIFKGHTRAVLQLLVKDDTLISSSEDGSIMLWDLINDTKLVRLKKHQWDVDSIAYKDNILFSGSDDYSIKMWDLSTNKVIKTLKSAHSGTITSLLVYKNTIISGSADGTIKIRDFKTGALLKTLKGHKRGVTALALNHDMLVSTSIDRNIILWNLKTNKMVKRLKGHSKRIYSVYVDDENIITGARDNKIKIWGYDPSIEFTNYEDEATKQKFDLIKSLKISPKAITDLAQDENNIIFSTFGMVMYLNKVTYEFVKSYSTLEKVVLVKKKKKKEKVKKAGRANPLSTELQQIHSISLDGILLSVALDDATVKVWNTESDEPIALLKEHELQVLDVYSDGDYIVTSSAKGIINIRDFETKDLLNTIEGHQWDVRSSIIYEDKLITSSDDLSIKIWDLEDGELLNTFRSAHFDNINKIMVKDNILISCSDDGTIKFRDIETGKLLRVLKGHTKGVLDFVFDNEYLISASRDHTLKAWNIKTGQLVKTLKGHTDDVTAVIITDDYIVSGSADKTLKMWKYYE
jgi:WD40 repeat protein